LDGKGKFVPPQSIVPPKKTGNHLQFKFTPRGGELQRDAAPGNSGCQQQFKNLGSSQGSGKQIFHVDKEGLYNHVGQRIVDMITSVYSLKGGAAKHGWLVQDTIGSLLEEIIQRIDLMNPKTASTLESASKC
jgi:hypothetical protein